MIETCFAIDGAANDETVIMKVIDQAKDLVVSS